MAYNVASIFFFKQKTAYEMRISDWSSDVCSSDLSKLGVFLDPIADKIMVAAVILMLIATRDITGLNIIAAIIILLREIAVSGLREFLADLRVSVPVSKLAKWKTALQLIAL